MRFEANMARAEKHREAMSKAIEPISKALRKLLNDDTANIEHQPGDGWVVLFNGDHNACVNTVDFDALMQMAAEDALAYLLRRSI